MLRYQVCQALCAIVPRVMHFVSRGASRIVYHALWITRYLNICHVLYITCCASGVTWLVLYRVLNMPYSTRNTSDCSTSKVDIERRRWKHRCGVHWEHNAQRVTACAAPGGRTRGWCWECASSYPCSEKAGSLNFVILNLDVDMNVLETTRVTRVRVTNSYVLLQ